MALRGKRVVFASETNEGRKFDISKVKELTGGDTLNARELYSRHHVEITPTHLLLVLTNHRPQAPAGDYALWQRIHLIPFTEAFVNKPQRDNEHHADPDLPAKLRAEASGILAWMVRGCLEYQKLGLNPPESVRAATEEYRQDEDLIGHFLDDCCLLGQTYEVKAGLLYKEYQRWCDENGHRSLSGTRFGKEMKARFDSYQDYKGVAYIGVGLLES